MRVKGTGTPSACLRECERMDLSIVQQFIEQMPAGIAILDREARFLAVSRRALSILAWCFSTEVPVPDEVIGSTVREIWPKAPPRWRDINARALEGEELDLGEDFVQRRDGRGVWLRRQVKPWRDACGRIGGLLVVGDLITEQVEARHALAGSEARFRATFENAAVGISHVAPDGRFLRFNAAFSRLLGWPADELITKSVWEISHPDDLAVELPQLEQLRDGKIDSYSLDKRNRRKDGTFIWTHRTTSCVRDSNRSIDYFVSVLEDISARKCAEEQVQLLMREAGHRVKNLLGLVQAIARQTADASSEAFVGRFAERIQALAASQDLLHRNQRRGADLEGLVHAQVAFFADLIGSRIAVGGPKLHLNAAAAQAIGLTLHELATNAGKYGALSTDAGRVDVSWRSERDVFTMSWTECDGPPVLPPKRRGFGSTVIDSMAKLATGGEIQLDYAPSGLVWRLRCPAANALETPNPGLSKAPPPLQSSTV
jgi:PAS domain S-box-containing protein